MRRRARQISQAPWPAFEKFPAISLDDASDLKEDAIQVIMDDASDSRSRMAALAQLQALVRDGLVNTPSSLFEVLQVSLSRGSISVVSRMALQLVRGISVKTGETRPTSDGEVEDVREVESLSEFFLAVIPLVAAAVTEQAEGSEAGPCWRRSHATRVRRT
jgi:hypothetical protein